MAKMVILSKKYLIFLIIVLVLLLIILFGARIYLFFNLLVGHDVLVRVTTNQDNFFLTHGQEASLKVKTDIVTNPFCTVYCDYTFKSLSSNKTIKSEAFSLKTITPVDQEFFLIPPSLGTGQELYMYEIDCNSKKTILCDTTEEIKSRTLLITLNYNLTEEEQKLKETSKNELLFMSKNMGFFKINLDRYVQVINDLNKSPDMAFFNDKIKNASSFEVQTDSSLNQAKILWNSQDYMALGEKLQETSSLMENLNKSFNSLVIEFSFYTSNYNSQINKTTELSKNIQNISNLNLSDEISNNLSNILEDYNLFIKNFNNFSFGVKEEKINNLNMKISSLRDSINFQDMTTSKIRIFNITLFNESLIEINPIESNLSYELPEPQETCCLNGECTSCCNESCYYDKSKFPLVFLHGHNFNKGISADKNIHLFEDIKKNLEDFGYINGGFILASEGTPGIWGKTNYPLSLATSYYFDVLKDTKGETIFESQKDSLDVYALRLNDIIKEIKKRTGKEKITLVTHSMGGLVARRYIQIFGEEDIEKLILVMAPNHGISGNTKNYCNIFGSEIECKDMYPDSVFMSKLNSADIPKIPVYNIIGIGCNMEGEQGDGVLTNSTAYLSWAKNYYLNGTCDDISFKFFHTEITYPNKYPEFIILLKEIIKN